MNFVWLLNQSVSVLLFAWPVTLILLVFAGTSFAYAQNRRQLVSAKNSLPLAGLMIFPLAIAILAAILQAQMQTDPATHAFIGWHYRSKYGPVLVGLLFWLHPIYGAWLVMMLKGFRVFAVSIVLLTFWLTCASDFIAQMSISGDWL